MPRANDAIHRINIAASRTHSTNRTMFHTSDKGSRTRIQDLHGWYRSDRAQTRALLYSTGPDK
jgi:hypothetical protein